MNRISLIVFVTFFLLTGMATAQKACDYQSQSVDILGQAIYNSILEEIPEYDSIRVNWEGQTWIFVDGNSSESSFLSNDYTVKYRRHGGIKGVRTNCLKAKFKYRFYGALKSIRFNYKVNGPLYEGTFLNASLKIEDGSLLDISVDSGLFEFTIDRFD